MEELYAKVLAIGGAIWFSRILLNISRFIHIYTRRSSLPRYHHHSKTTNSPPWALVTGASDGIGRGYAYELARHGFNVVLHGRNASKLATVQEQLLKAYPKIETRLLILDASLSGETSIREMNLALDPLRELHLTVLINNVGTGTRPTGHVFSRYEEDIPSDIDWLINTNARFPVQITRAVLPLLLGNGGPALVFTTCSITEVGSPFLAIYSATKAFMAGFSRALKREMDAEGRRGRVEVLAIMTAQVTGTATSCGKRSWVQPDAMEFARAALGRVGCGFDVVEGWWAHAVLNVVTRGLPDRVFSKVLAMAVREEMRKDGKSA